MNVENLTAQAAAICLRREELPADRDTAGFCTLIRKLQRSRGLPVWKSMDARVFVLEDRALLLAWPTELMVFRFSSLEALLQAASACPPLPSSLCYLEEDWYLLLQCVRGQAPAALFEFAQWEGGEDLAKHLREHGELVIPREALFCLRSHFAAK